MKKFLIGVLNRIGVIIEETPVRKTVKGNGNSRGYVPTTKRTTTDKAHVEVELLNPGVIREILNVDMRYHLRISNSICAHEIGVFVTGDTFKQKMKDPKAKVCKNCVQLLTKPKEKVA